MASPESQGNTPKNPDSIKKMPRWKKAVLGLMALGVLGVGGSFFLSNHSQDSFNQKEEVMASIEVEKKTPEKVNVKDKIKELYTENNLNPEDFKSDFDDYLKSTPITEIISPEEMKDYQAEIVASFLNTQGYGTSPYYIQEVVDVDSGQNFDLSELPRYVSIHGFLQNGSVPSDEIINNFLEIQGFSGIDFGSSEVDYGNTADELLPEKETLKNGDWLNYNQLKNVESINYFGSEYPFTFLDFSDLYKVDENGVDLTASSKNGYSSVIEDCLANGQICATPEDGNLFTHAFTDVHKTQIAKNTDNFLGGQVVFNMKDGSKITYELKGHKKIDTKDLFNEAVKAGYTKVSEIQAYIEQKLNKIRDQSHFQQCYNYGDKIPSPSDETDEEGNLLTVQTGNYLYPSLKKIE